MAAKRTRAAGQPTAGRVTKRGQSHQPVEEAADPSEAISKKLLAALAGKAPEEGLKNILDNQPGAVEILRRVLVSHEGGGHDATVHHGLPADMGLPDENDGAASSVDPSLQAVAPVGVQGTYYARQAGAHRASPIDETDRNALTQFAAQGDSAEDHNLAARAVAHVQYSMDTHKDVGVDELDATQDATYVEHDSVMMASQSQAPVGDEDAEFRRAQKRLASTRGPPRQRTRWSELEEEQLLELIKTYGSLSWKDLKTMDKSQRGEILAKRTAEDMRYKARNLKFAMLKDGRSLDECPPLAAIKLTKLQITSLRRAGIVGPDDDDVRPPTEPQHLTTDVAM